MGRYLQMYLRGGLSDNGTRIVSADGLRTMTTPGPIAHLGAWADGASARYAMGWFVGGPWREPVVFHPGNTPDSSAMITVVPGRGTAVATLMNLSHELPVPGNPSAPDRMSRNVVDSLLGEAVDTGPSTTRFYLVFDLIALLLVGAAGWACGGPPTLSAAASLSPAAGSPRRDPARRGGRCTAGHPVGHRLRVGRRVGLGAGPHPDPGPAGRPARVDNGPPAGHSGPHEETGIAACPPAGAELRAVLLTAAGNGHASPSPVGSG